VCVWGCFDNCVCVLLICVLVFTGFCIVCTVFLYRFVYVYLFFFVLSVLVQGLLPPSDNLIALNNNNNNETCVQYVYPILVVTNSY
jgi:hypothetical protein